MYGSPFLRKPIEKLSPMPLLGKLYRPLLFKLPRSSRYMTDGLSRFASMTELPSTHAGSHAVSSDFCEDTRGSFFSSLCLSSHVAEYSVMVS